LIGDSQRMLWQLGDGPIAAWASRTSRWLA
jgi:hypothetical protein